MAIGSGLRQGQKKKRGLAVVLVILLLIGIAAGWRLFDGETVERLKEYFSTVVMRSPSEQVVRGTIYDRNYKELAVSLPRVSVYARTREMASVETAAKELAPILGVDEQEVLEKLRGDELRIWLARDIAQKQEEQVRTARIEGIYLHKEYSRYYPQKDVAAHLIGFVEDDIGLSGVEYYYDRLVQKLLDQESGAEFHGSAGQHMQLTIDLKVQDILEKLVEDLAAGRQNVRIGAYAMDVTGGALVASVQSPAFDPNRYRVYSQSLLENLLLEPMLLPQVFRGILRDSAAIQSQHELRGQVHPWSVSARQQDLGSELRLWEKLGLAAGPPQDFGNSEKPLAPAPEYVVIPGEKKQDFGTVPESISPLRLLAALGTLMNGGERIEPYVVQAVIEPAGEEEFHLHPAGYANSEGEVVSREVSREISKMIGEIGQASEPGGTIVKGRIEAEVRGSEGFAHQSNELYYAAVPVELTELAVLVTIQGGTTRVQARSGATVADPGSALAQVLPRIAVLQKVGKSIIGVAEPEEGQSGNYPVHLDKVREAVRSSLGESRGVQEDPGEMPELVGLSLRKSLRLLQQSPCRIRIFGTGRVVAQEPAAGTPLAGVKECTVRLQKQEDVSLETLEEKTSKKK